MVYPDHHLFLQHAWQGGDQSCSVRCVHLMINQRIVMSSAFAHFPEKSFGYLLIHLSMKPTILHWELAHPIHVAMADYKTYFISVKLASGALACSNVRTASLLQSATSTFHGGAKCR